jgi:transcription initiation factor TFIIIB Brf1 subunit/transcription initiation factor TFIIB
LGSDIDHKPEWRNDTNTGEDLSRCNLARNEMLLESSNSTCIMIKPNASKTQYEMQRTMIWTGVPYNERAMKNKMDEISYVCKIHDIPDAIIEYSHKLYYDVIQKLEEHKHKRKRGKNDTGLRAAAVFLAFQDDGKPRTYKEIAKLFNIESKYVSDGINMFEDLIRINGKVSIYSDYIDEFCSSLDLNEEIRNRVANIADKADRLGILENNAPTSIVAGCINYVAVEMALPIRPADIASRCKVSPPTINKVCNKLFRRALDLSDD